MPTDPNDPNFIHPFIGFDIPGSETRETEIVRFPSGAIRRFIKTIDVSFGNDLQYRTNAVLDIVPPLDCSDSPRDSHDAVECYRCLSIVCATRHSITCPSCGRISCTACLGRTAVNGTTMVMCKECARENETHPLVKIYRKLLWD
ncbi:MAG: hypothetical protein V1809_03910 [Planctomycetota bacterium]